MGQGRLGSHIIISTEIKSTGPGFGSARKGEGGFKDDLCVVRYVSSLRRKPWEVEFNKVENPEFNLGFFESEVQYLETSK